MTDESKSIESICKENKEVDKAYRSYDAASTEAYFLYRGTENQGNAESRVESRYRDLEAALSAAGYKPSSRGRYRRD